jgi:hypothetical protein
MTGLNYKRNTSSIPSGGGRRISVTRARMALSKLRSRAGYGLEDLPVTRILRATGGIAKSITRLVSWESKWCGSLGR